MVLLLQRKGAQVAVIDVNPESLQETSNLSGATGKQLKLYALDITNREIVQHTATQILADFGSVQGLINNAGIIQPFIPVKSLNENSIRRGI